MGKVIALGPGGRAQAPARDDRCRPVIEFVLAHQLLDQDLLSPVCTSMARADELRRALNRSASYYCSCGQQFCTRKYKNYPPDNGCPAGGQRVSCRADVVLWTDPADQIAKLRIEFRLRDKRDGIAAVMQRYGPDPNQWPYYSRRRAKGRRR